jgi:four helix bundle protein
MIRDVTDLRIYEISLKLLKPLSELAKKVPDRELRFQIMDAGKGVAAMIAEGFAKKKSVKEFKRFLEMAMGSSDEVITHLREIGILFEILKEESEKLIPEFKSLSKQINSTTKNWS